MSYAAFSITSPKTDFIAALQLAISKGATLVRFATVTSIADFKTNTYLTIFSFSKDDRIIGDPPARITASAGGTLSSPCCSPSALLVLLLQVAGANATLAFNGSAYSFTGVVGTVPAIINPSDIGNVRDVPVPLGTDQTGSTFGGAPGSIIISPTRPDPSDGFGGNGPPLQ